MDEPVVAGRLAERGSGFGLAPMIPAGMRAVAVKVNEVVGVAGFVLPGMRVDVLVTVRPPGDAGARTSTILQNVPVVSAGQQIQADGSGRAVNVPVVTLLVTPEQAETLTLAGGEGRIQLVLRNSSDQALGDASRKGNERVVRAAPRRRRRWRRRPSGRRLGWWRPPRRRLRLHRTTRSSCSEGLRGPSSWSEPATRSKVSRRGMRVRDYRLVLLVALAAAAVPARGQTAERELSLTVGGSTVIDCPFDMARISTSTPEVVDTVAVTRREVLLLAKGYGEATVGMWSKSGDRLIYRVTVAHDLGQVRDLLRRTFPGEEVEVQSARDSLSLTGRVSSQAVADRATALLAPLAKSVVNNLQVAAPGPDKQVMLRVKFAELNRSAASSFGVNLVSTGALNTVGRLTTGQIKPPTPAQGVSSGGGGILSGFSISDALNIFAFRPDLNLGAFIQSLRTQGMLQILAEPNLVTTDGKEASFHVGGEFPVPIVQGGATAGAVTIMFREFGIKLTFLPRVTAQNTIKMHVKPEVSSIDLANGVIMSGFSIPALTTRRMETDVELAEGQSFAIAGLIDDRVTENLSKVPGLANIPILGVLFKSREQNKTKTELVVIVTPAIIDPAEAGRQAAGPVMPMEFLPAAEPARAPAGNQKQGRK